MNQSPSEHRELTADAERDLGPGAQKRSSAEIERDIETTLQQIDDSLQAIEERFDIRRAFGPLRDFFSSPPGKILAAGAILSFARRRPLLTCTAGLAYLYFRRPSRDGRPVKEQFMSDKAERPSKEGKVGFEQAPLKGPQMKEPIMAIEAGSETVTDGEYRCEDCGNRIYLEESIIVPACTDCRGRRFLKESD